MWTEDTVLCKCDLDPNTNDRTTVMCIWQGDVTKNLRPNTRQRTLASLMEQWNLEFIQSSKYRGRYSNYKIRMGGSYYKRIPKKVLNGTPDQCENQEQDGEDTSKILVIRGCSRRAEDRGGWRRLLRGSGPRRGCGAMDGNELKTTLTAVQLTLQVRIETSIFTENNVV